MPNAMLPRERGDFSAIVDRPPLRLPGGARLIVWTIVNYEVWDIARAMPRQVLPAPTGQVLLPDVPNWSWHEYGMRVGAWRFFELFARRALGRRSPSMPASARTIRASPRRRGAPVGSSWATATIRCRCTCSRIKPRPSGAASDPGAFQRTAAGGLARAGPDPDARDPRPARRRRHQIYRRLGL